MRIDSGCDLCGFLSRSKPRDFPAPVRLALVEHLQVMEQPHVFVVQVVVVVEVVAAYVGVAVALPIVPLELVVALLNVSFPPLAIFSWHKKRLRDLPRPSFVA